MGFGIFNSDMSKSKYQNKTKIKKNLKMDPNPEITSTSENTDKYSGIFYLLCFFYFVFRFERNIVEENCRNKRGRNLQKGKNNQHSPKFLNNF